MTAKITYDELKRMQELPLDKKIELTRNYILEFYNMFDGNIYTSFSGGKDSSVLLDIARKIIPEITAVFSNTGLEYREIVEFVKTKDNIDIVRPKTTYKQVIENDGYPVISKLVSRFIRDLQNPTENNIDSRNLRLTGYTKGGKYMPSYKLPSKWHFLINAPFKISDACCDHLKKEPLNTYHNKKKGGRIIGVMASESLYRSKHLRHWGITNKEASISMPIGFWTEQDILKYILKYNLDYCKDIYGDIVEHRGILRTSMEQRTGCMFCMFGVHLEKSPNRFQRMALTHPKEYKHCMEVLKCKEVLSFINVPTTPFTQHKLKDICDCSLD